jgi:methanogenic corrinoid protein MtbC1
VSEHSRRAADRRLADIGKRYQAALRCADAPAAEAVVAEALAAGITPTTIMVDVITAAMRRIGECWEQGELTVAEEHLATGLSYRALLPLQEPLQIAPPRSRERVVLAAVAGQAHVLGLRMVADVLEGAGFNVLYLGANVPAGDLQEFVADHEPAVLGLTSTQPRDGPSLAEAIVTTHDIRPECRIMLGGEGVPLAWRGPPYPWAPDAGAALDAVQELLHGPPRSFRRRSHECSAAPRRRRHRPRSRTRPRMSASPPRSPRRASSRDATRDEPPSTAISPTAIR